MYQITEQDVRAIAAELTGKASVGESALYAVLRKTSYVTIARACRESDCLRGRGLEEDILHDVCVRVWTGAYRVLFTDGGVNADPKAFGERLREVLKGCDISTTMRNRIVGALSERDESAPIQKNRRGDIVYDKSTRDTERVPMLENVDEYMEREVYPYVPDAHVTFDENLTAKKPVIPSVKRSTHSVPGNMPPVSMNRRAACSILFRKTLPLS